MHWSLSINLPPEYPKLHVLAERSGAYYQFILFRKVMRPDMTNRFTDAIAWQLQWFYEA
jgi:hypothetical protein